MRHVPKNQLCAAFESYKSTITTWNDFRNANVKLLLHQHLWAEQKGICIYCQQKIPQKVSINSAGNLHPSHIEHIRPKSISMYPHLVFEHMNLAISCEGFDIQNPIQLAIHQFCGAPKANQYNESLFLHPVENQEIEDFFTYNIQGQIQSSEKDDNMANFMISLLNLNHPTLVYMREQLYLLIVQEVAVNQLDISDYLDENYLQLPSFYSMLKQLFDYP
jgi:uncharacterized protein (TIGR02646 family)